METLLKEIRESLKVRQNGVTFQYYKNNQYVESREIPQRGKGTKQYTYRRIQMLHDKLNELRKEIADGVYDFKG